MTAAETFALARAAVILAELGGLARTAEARGVFGAELQCEITTLVAGFHQRFPGLWPSPQAEQEPPPRT